PCAVPTLSRPRPYCARTARPRSRRGAPKPSRPRSGRPAKGVSWKSRGETQGDRGHVLDASRRGPFVETARSQSGKIEFQPGQEFPVKMAVGVHAPAGSKGIFRRVGHPVLLIMGRQGEKDGFRKDGDARPRLPIVEGFLEVVW